MADVAAAIASGRLLTVCAGFPQTLSPDDPQRPVWLETYVAQHMERGDDLGVCTLFHRPAVPAAA